MDWTAERYCVGSTYALSRDSVEATLFCAQRFFVSGFDSGGAKAREIALHSLVEKESSDRLC